MSFYKSLLAVVMSLAFSIFNVLAEVGENDVVGYLDMFLDEFVKDKNAGSSGTIAYRKLLKVNKDGSFLVQDFYIDSNNKFTEPYIVKNIDDMRPVDGLLVTWHKNGQKESEKNYKNHQLDGLQTFWYKNGRKLEINYKDGQLVK